MYLAKSFSICYNANRQMNDSTHEVRKTPGVPITGGFYSVLARWLNPLG